MDLQKFEKAKELKSKIKSCESKIRQIDKKLEGKHISLYYSKILYSQRDILYETIELLNNNFLSL